MKIFILTTLLFSFVSNAYYRNIDYRIQIEGTSDIEVINKFQDRIDLMITGKDIRFNTFLQQARCNVYLPNIYADIKKAQEEIELQNIYKNKQGVYSKVVRGKTKFRVGPCDVI